MTPSSSSTSTSSSVPTTNTDQQHEGPWDWRALEASLQKKKQHQLKQQSQSFGLGQQINSDTKFTLHNQKTAHNEHEHEHEHEHDDHHENINNNNKTTTNPLSVLLQPHLTCTPVPSSTPPSSSSSSPSSTLLPLPITLRSRCTERCRAELSEGRPGIVLKPKLNPLEGDTSLRSGHGQWWKKDSSAVHSVPKIQIVQLQRRQNQAQQRRRESEAKPEPTETLEEKHNQEQQTETEEIVLLLKITNPTLSVVRLRLGNSNYPGIPTITTVQNTHGNSTIKRTRLLKQLLVDSLQGTRVSALLAEPPKKQETATTAAAAAPVFSTPYTEWIKLEAVEDSLFGPSQVPKIIQEWNPTTTTATSNDAAAAATTDSTTQKNYALIAGLGDTAWLELCLPPHIINNNNNNNNSSSNNNNNMAFCMELQIAVGKGSWESSLIQPQGENDSVKFDLVAVLPIQT